LKTLLHRGELKTLLRSGELKTLLRSGIFRGMAPASESRDGRKTKEPAKHCSQAARFRRAIGPVIPCRVASQQSPTPLHRAK
jgi:hypothetical protein